MSAVPAPDRRPRRIRTITPPLAASVLVPGSKSVANRALVCAALADGVSEISGVPPGDDSAAMIDALRLLDIGVRAGPLTGDVVVAGRGGRIGPDRDGDQSTEGQAWLGSEQITLPTRLAGTTSRFVTAVAALGGGLITIDGEPSLRDRPMTPLHDALRAMGAKVVAGERWGHLPVSISGPIAPVHGRVAVRGDVSSQYITALMLIAPAIPGGLHIDLTTPLVSRSYLGITAAVMAAFGIDDVVIGEDHVEVGQGTYRATAYVVEPDASSAGYPLAAAAIVGGTVHVPGLTAASLQGDARFSAVLGDMGCTVVVDDGGTTVTRDGPLRGIDIDMVDMSDLVPTLAVVAPFAHTPTRITGVGFIRRKESDRIGDLCRELRRAGVAATELDDGVLIEPGSAHAAVLGTHHDHRLAMAFGVLGLAADGIEVADPDVVTKSWPGYWAMLDDLR